MLLDSVCPVSRLSSYMKCTNAFQISLMTACTVCDIQLHRVCVNALTCRANTELLQKCKLTVMNAVELRAWRCVWWNKRVTILLGGRPLRCSFIRHVVLIRGMSVGIRGTSYTQPECCFFLRIKMSHYHIYLHAFLTSWHISRVTKMFGAWKDLFKNLNHN